MSPRDACLALNLLPGLGPVKVRRLIDAFGTAQKVLSAPTVDLQKVAGIGPDISTQIHNWRNQVDLESEMAELERRGLDFIIHTDANYPPPLREIYDPPLGLYVWGDLQASDWQAIAVVGSRRASHYGVQAARKLSFQLAHAGITILSGLARGIDTAAHEGALAAKGRTIAVIGSGLGKIYPPENLELARRISDGHGAVISEFPINWGPNKTTFPMRNRIVSGWSHGVLVVEAPERSGSLITANLAADQGRSVFAVPGPIDRDSSAGCNALIKNGARLVTDARDILEDFNQLPLIENNSLAANKSTPQATTLGKLPPIEASVMQALADDQLGIDDLIHRSQLAPHEVSTALLSLELKRLIQVLPGSRFVKLIG